ncbi:hypothetical protein M405DRAFT_837384 [Rhizopogon salebrosus TDB-379]|nr:hypothetical protein M405DRAFT_837384 [Rhizopogon salebrosus TDB-379]
MTLESPIKTLRANIASVSSIRPYAKTIFAAPVQLIGQNIAPWAMLNAGISPVKPAPPLKDMEEFEPAPAFRLTHKRTLSPAPAAELELIYQALCPAVNRAPVSGRPVFPSLACSRGSLGTSPVFKKAKGHHRKESSLVSSECAQSRCDVDIAGSIGNERDSMSLPILPDARRNLGLAGTLGGSVGAQELDASDPDSDIPDELQVILSSLAPENDDTMSFKPNPVITHSPLPLPGLPPEMPLPLPKGSIPNVPVFCISVIDEDDHHVDIEEAEMSSEDDTKKSFDFTGELKKLNESESRYGPAVFCSLMNFTMNCKSEYTLPFHYEALQRYIFVVGTVAISLWNYSI